LYGTSPFRFMSRDVSSLVIILSSCRVEVCSFPIDPLQLRPQRIGSEMLVRDCEFAPQSSPIPFVFPCSSSIVSSRWAVTQEKRAIPPFQRSPFLPVSPSCQSFRTLICRCRAFIPYYVVFLLHTRRHSRMWSDRHLQDSFSGFALSLAPSFFVCLSHMPAVAGLFLALEPAKFSSNGGSVYLSHIPVTRPFCFFFQLASIPTVLTRCERLRL